MNEEEGRRGESEERSGDFQDKHNDIDNPVYEATAPVCLPYVHTRRYKYYWPISEHILQRTFIAIETEVTLFKFLI